METLYGVTGMVRERKEKFRPVHTRYLITGILLCIASVIPLFISLIYGDQSIWPVIGLVAILVLSAIGVLLIVRVSIVWGSYQMLLEEEDYTRESKANNKRYGYLIGAYWCLAAAIYLGWSFIGNSWDKSWILWPVAGVAFGAAAGIVGALKSR